MPERLSPTVEMVFDGPSSNKIKTSPLWTPFIAAFALQPIVHTT